MRSVPTRPPTRWTPTTSSELVLQAHGKRTQHDRDEADDGRPERTHRTTRRRDGDEARDDSRCGTQRCGVAIADLLRDEPADACGACGHERVEEDDRRGVVRRDLRAGVEAEPPEPQECGSDHDEGEIVRLHRRAWPAEARPQQDHQCEGSNAGVDVDRGAAGEVDDAELGDPAACLGVEVEDPVRDGEVDQSRPDGSEDQPCTELRAIGDGTRDKAHREAGEHRLECHEDHGGHRRLGVIDHEALQAEVLRHVA